MHTSDRRAYAVITAAWVLTILLVSPTGNFPLIDDWSYAWAVNSLIADGEWRLHDWTSMPLATQIIWGALFAWLFGFSFDTLRASTLVLAWAATAGVYALMRQCGAERITALLLAGAIAACPVFFSLSFSFMTDVPAAAFAIWALFYAARYLESQRRRDLIACIALLTATMLIRQTAAALVVGCAAGIVFVRPRKTSIATAALTIAVPIGALVVYNAFITAGHKPALYDGQQQQVLGAIMGAPREAAHRVRVLGAIFYLYFGFLMLPVVWLIRAPSSIKARVAAGAVLAASIVYLPVRDRMLPILGGALYDVAVYSLTMPRSDLWPHAPVAVRFALTVAALSVSVILAFAVFGVVQSVWRREPAPRHRRAIVVLAVVALAAYLAPYTQVHALDRYLMVPAVLLMMLLTSAGAFRERVRPAATSAAAATLVAFAAFDVVATRDYFAFSRTQWSAMQTMIDEGVPPEEIRGGLEVGGWLGAAHGAHVEEIRRWSSVEPPASAVISLGPLPEFEVHRSYEFPRFIGDGPGMVYDLRRPSR